MELKLINLPSGHISLEFSADRIEDIKQLIAKNLGGFRVERRSTYDVISIQSSRFVSETEYDDGSLISDSDEGDAILRRIVDLWKK